MMVIQMMALRCTLVTMGLTQTLGVRVGYSSTEFHGSTKDRDRISLIQPIKTLTNKPVKYI
jgi:hypothetical protein